MVLVALGDRRNLSQPVFQPGLEFPVRAFGELCVCVSDLRTFLKLVSGSRTFFVFTPTTAQSCFLCLQLLSKPLRFLRGTGIYGFKI